MLRGLPEDVNAREGILEIMGGSEGVPIGDGGTKTIGGILYTVEGDIAE